MDQLEERLLRELSGGEQLTADDLANRIDARDWVELSTPLSQLASTGYVTVVGPLGRATTCYRIHPQGRAALDRAT